MSSDDRKLPPRAHHRHQQQEDGNIPADAPSWRFAQIRQPSSVSSSSSATSREMIDKASFFGKATSAASAPGPGASSKPSPPPQGEAQSTWHPKSLRPVPAFYPLEKSSRFITDELYEVTGRLSECLRILSVQAVYDDEAATAQLMTAENVEMHLSLWKTNPQQALLQASARYPEGIVVELQRRKGDSITFHRYSRYILDAAIGDFDASSFVDIESGYTKKVERMLSRNRTANCSEEENAVIAIEIAHGLLMKDRMDARQLGLESLCLLTDPKKTGATTALIASRVLLLGTLQVEGEESPSGSMFDESPFAEIRETILSIVQLGRINEDEHFGDYAEGTADVDGVVLDVAPPSNAPFIVEQEYPRVLHNLALAVLANALDVIENIENLENEPEDTKPAARARLGSRDIANAFMNDAKEISDKEILSTLISELGKAANTPHNACLSAKCLRSLLGASDDARRKAKELGAKNVVSTALDVGVRTHAKLETECRRVEKVMTLTTTERDEEEEQQQQGDINDDNNEEETDE